MSLVKYAGLSLIALSSSMANAGGWEAGTLDTSLLYSEGSTLNVSTASLSPSHKATTYLKLDNTQGTNRSVLGDESRTSIAGKFDIGSFSVGLTQYKSGSIQLGGGAKTAVGWIPDADATLTSTSVITKYGVGDYYDILAGITMNSLGSTEVSTVLGTYNVSPKTSTGYVLGGAYSAPAIALRVEALYQPKSKISTDTSFTETVVQTGNPAAPTFADGVAFTALGAVTYAAAGGVNAVQTEASFTSTLSRPEMLTLNFQTGVAEDTLVFGSVHQATWSDAQIFVDTVSAVSEITTAFTDTTAYTIGVGRKISDSLALSASFKSESGSGATSTSLFTVSNGSQGISLGGSYKFDNIEVRAGYNYTRLGAVTVSTLANGAGTVQAVYDSNSVSAVGASVTVNF